MRVLVDASVLFSAVVSRKGASRALLGYAVAGDVKLIVSPDEAAIRTATTYTVQKDAPVVAAAIVRACNYLTTFDRKHLIDPPEVSANSGLTIVTPDVVLDAIRANLRGMDTEE